MKLFQLKAIADHLNDFNTISRVRRVEDNTLELLFDKYHSYFFNMTRGQSIIYKAPSAKPMQTYNAPFDALLHSLVSASKLIKVTTPNEDRILRFELTPKSSYKEMKIFLQLEFTGKNTNAILIDENETVIEALRHVDAQSSFRVIRPGVELLNIPPLGQNQTTETLSDVEGYLETVYRQNQIRQLDKLRQEKLTLTLKKIYKLTQLLDTLPDQEKLNLQVQEYQNCAHIILANLHQIKPYDTKLFAYDFSGEPITIELPKNITTNRIGDHFFTLSKRAKNKAKNIHIEEENLKSQKAFYENIAYAITQAKEPYELELLVPKRGKSQRKKEKLKDGELFWIEDYKVYVGRNSNENQKLLGIAKANDLWMHIRGIPSSHVIIRTDKQNLPQSVVEAAAKLCVDFSVQNPGEYEVDYAKRKFVKLQEGSNVLYNKYDTLRVRKEGIEIRQ